MKSTLAAFSVLAMLCGPALAEDTREMVEDEGGITNPEELTITFFAKHHDFKKGNPILCSLGWLAVKMSYNEEGAKIFHQCAEIGNEASMIWLAQLYDNGLGVEKDHAQSVEWERIAAERGYSIGEYNYGLSILRGRAPIQDPEVGKLWIQRAAQQGDSSAQTLIDEGYDLDVAIPDADENKLLF
jgi:hypothetical protein